MGEALAKACDYNDALIVAKAAKIVRKQLLEQKKECDGTLKEVTWESVPQSLLEFVSVSVRYKVSARIWSITY